MTTDRKRRLIEKVTGLCFCDRECGCGENNQLWWFPPPLWSACMFPAWLPGRMNEAEIRSVWRWLVEHGKVPRRKAHVRGTRSTPR